MIPVFVKVKMDRDNYVGLHKLGYSEGRYYFGFKKTSNPLDVTKYPYYLINNDGEFYGIFANEILFDKDKT